MVAYEKWSQAEVRLYSNSVREKSLLQFVILLDVPCFFSTFYDKLVKYF